MNNAEKTNVESLLEITAEKIKGIVDVNTVVGDAVNVSKDISVIPVSRISYGFGGGGSDFQVKNAKSDTGASFGGGWGSGVTIAPVGFLVMKDGDVRFVQVEPFSGAVDRAIAMIPDAVKGISALFKMKKSDNKSDGAGS
jgi:sporulation protein YtfJ